MKAKNLRNYEGLGRSSKPTGIPKATPIGENSGPWPTPPGSDIHCPNCGCKEVMQIEVEVENNLLRGNNGVGYYIGCPACPWASPMMSVSTSGDSNAVE